MLLFCGRYCLIRRIINRINKFVLLIGTTVFWTYY
nr:MAG TPA: Merozoite Surface Antigen 2 (MSA-2) family [Microviridae sp.]